MDMRYVIRPDPGGFSVLDLWSGQPAIVAGTPQSRLVREDAEHLAQLLNASAAREPAGSTG